ncbi:MAG: alpha/beta hydrolase [Prevotellaceae bacterium]|jgi:acetyl esterase/lipase|nr:alpha/beta hydrolase [Prevotellaceae bacterium]
MRNILLTTIMLISFPAFSQQTLSLPVWPNGAPSSNGITTPEEQMENSRIANVSEAQIFVYLPKSTTPTSAVIICPGGGYVRLAVEHEGHEFAKWLNQQGIAGIVLKYRMPNECHEVPLSDAQQTLRIVRQNAGKWNIDPNNVGIAGFSAGGHLASTAATHFTDSATRPDFALLFYPVITTDTTFAHVSSRYYLIGKNAPESLAKEYSNELQVTPQTPPTLLFHSDDDKAVPVRNSVDFYAALKKNNVPAAMYIFPSGGHGWGMKEEFEYGKEWKELLKKWLEAIL